MSDVFVMEDWFEKRNNFHEILFESLKRVLLADAINHWRGTMKNSEIRRRNRRCIKELIDFGVLKLRTEDGNFVTIGDFHNRDQKATVEAIQTMTGEHLRCEKRKDYYLTYLRFIDYLNDLSNGLFGKEKMMTWICTKKCCSLSLWRDSFPISQALKKEFMA